MRDEIARRGKKRCRIEHKGKEVKGLTQSLVHPGDRSKYRGSVGNPGARSGREQDREKS